MIGSVVAVAALIVASALFVAAEFSLVAARRTQVEPLALRSASARSTLAAMDNVSVMMACAQLGITVTGLVLGAVGEPAVSHLIEPVLRAWDVPEAAAVPIGMAVALLIVVGLHVAFGEMVPKNIALARPERTAMMLAPALRALAAVLSPVVRGLDHLANLVVRAVGVTPTAEVASTFTRQEVAELVAQSARAGLLDPEDEELVGSALGFDTATVDTVLLPDEALVAVGPTPTAADVERACAESGFSRFPVLSATSGGDPFAGFVHVRDVLTVPADRADRPLPDELIRPLPVVAAGSSLRAALDRMRTDRVHMCRVAAPDGPSGMVLLEDVIEVLVGEIVDATRRTPPGSLG